ncbi:hypothetical protein [Streptomyces acidicola]|uniref:Uncharacterized protein n=1 Tax=Streptomyces acidicola TaxID=2596892 RepID=A0A5N8WK69_9ACTN|nr:hypothetical protein [Streptomyces acidicola]MPY47097.1 hypothetical protein [Streptomyces acidicola]MPY47236.1 hypothetical protein [Streptomyces acidicola]
MTDQTVPLVQVDRAAQLAADPEAGQKPPNMPHSVPAGAATGNSAPEAPNGPQGGAESLDAYRQLLARLAQERAKALDNAPRCTLDEARWVNEGIASGLHIAAAWAITLFEGHDARTRYLAAGGGQAAAHDEGPSVAECRDADRRWPLERNGE